MGPTFGLTPGSFLTESYDMLLAMIFLEHYLHYFQEVQVLDNVHHLFYYDQALLKHIVFAMNQPWDNPNHCLTSDYDLESGIVTILTSQPPSEVFPPSREGSPG
jgi:hypothetical protein